MSRSILIDTSFLLPTLGFDVSDEIIECIKLLRGYEVHYLEVQLLEAMWKIVKVVKDEEAFGVVEDGLRAIRSGYTLISPEPDEFRVAYRLYELGHRDMVDNLLYSVSLKRGIPLLTTDKELIGFIGDVGWDRKMILTPREFLK